MILINGFLTKGERLALLGVLEDQIEELERVAAEPHSRLTELGEDQLNAFKKLIAVFEEEV